MSLQKSYEAATGITHASAYHKIITMGNNRVGGRMSVKVDIFADAQAKTDGKVPVGSYLFSIRTTDYDTYFANSVVDTEDQNTVERAYAYLKTLDEYSGASNV